MLKDCLSIASFLESIILIHECDCSRLFRTFRDGFSLGKVSPGVLLRRRHKMVLLGDPGCGKTSIITRLMYGSFDSAYQV